ncbi:hypothetical protein [Candidatus Tisiphia endosymbiont of Parasteatoda lunata]|uniref:hypothetical protein n=1 Tax=Candidatus Tisiphia endosymbiont of Parasteatoda lunata TaxID=3066275 RepID=UPI00313C62AE
MTIIEKCRVLLFKPYNSTSLIDGFLTFNSCALDTTTLILEVYNGLKKLDKEAGIFVSQ